MSEGDGTRAQPDLTTLRDELAAAGVRYLFGAYVDIHGVPKSKCVPIAHLADMAAGSELYTVGALEGMGELGPNEDECVGVPDLSRLTVLPWDRRFAVAPANLYLHGQPYPYDYRRLLQNQLDRARLLGYTVNFGIEPEVYVLRRTESGWQPWLAQDLVNSPTRGYDLEATVLADGFLEPMVGYLNELGWDVYSFDHEGGDGQYEFDFGYTDALTMADRMVLFRLMAKHVARTLGCVASFMPKPDQRSFGSGAHFRAPVFRAYGHNNRTLMLRLPMNRRCLEVRIADSAANVHLGAALTVAAGLDGVVRQLKPGDPVNIDTYSRSEKELAAQGIHRLPRTLGEAIDAFEASELCREVLGEQVHRSYAEYKRAEWLEYNTVVGEWEREKYLQLW